MRPLRILLGADTYPPDVNGAARFAERLGGGLARRGHDVHVLAPSPDGPAGRSEHDRVTIHRVRSLRCPGQAAFRVSPPWQAAGTASQLIRELAPDVAHVQAHFSVGRGLALAATRMDVPLVATNHFMPENLFAHAHVPVRLRGGAARFAWQDLRRVYRRAQVLTAPTPRAVELLTRETGLPALAISCGVEIGSYGHGPAVESRPATILFVGRLDPEKRVDELLHAAALLPTDHEWRLELIGDGICRDELEAMACTLGIAARVRFRGFVSDAELIAAYRACAVFCMPGVAELQSLVTLEAMAAGKPVVAADAMALPHLVRPGHNGLLHPPGDVRALSAALAEILDDQVLRRRMGAAGRELARGHDLSATVESFEDLYTRIAGITEPGSPVLTSAA
jgi:phosphatidylinositol alpha 1,6-mannosyltransferase